MSITVHQATRKQTKAKVAIAGGPGAGKTWSALKILTEVGAILEGQGEGEMPSNWRILFVDTEHGSASKYAVSEGGVACEGEWKFDVSEPETFSLKSAIEYIHYATKEKYDAIIFDTFSHYWQGRGGALEQVQALGGRFDHWKVVTPIFNDLIDTILAAPIHVFCCMRLDMAYEVVENEKGKKEPKKLGLQPIMRKDVEYVFDLYLTIDENSIARVEKSRTKFLPKFSTYPQPGREIAAALVKFCGDGAAAERYVLPAEIRNEFDALMHKVGEEAYNKALQDNGIESLLQVTSKDQAARLYKFIRDNNAKAAA